MPQKKKPLDPKRQAEIIADARRAQTTRAVSYRERALAVLPNLCARCGREFSGKDLRELTVHHRDHNHDNNPPDGSNWELLCLYCHDDEHQNATQRDTGGKGSRELYQDDASLDHNPFGALLDKWKDNSEEAQQKKDEGSSTDKN